MNISDDGMYNPSSLFAKKVKKERNYFWADPSFKLLHQGGCHHHQAFWAKVHFSQVLLSKVYFCKMYPTCVCFKLCEFISLLSPLQSACWLWSWFNLLSTGSRQHLFDVYFIVNFPWNKLKISYLLSVGSILCTVPISCSFKCHILQNIFYAARFL